MQKIIYIVPYFGQKNDLFQLWLKSCEYNSTVNWLIYTDTGVKTDKENIKIIDCSFDTIKTRIQQNFNFPIVLDQPYKLCDYRPAYSLIFQNEIKDYDFWGYCDSDMIFGNIRKFVTDDILENHDVIGLWGHSTIFRNTEEIRKQLKKEFSESYSYRKIFQTDKNLFFDEKGAFEIYRRQGLRIYTELEIADLNPSFWKFEIFHKDFRKKQTVKERNKNRVFYWDKGTLLGKSAIKSAIITEEFMYVHFLRRPMVVMPSAFKFEQLLIIPNKIIGVKKFILSVKEIKYLSYNRMDKYWLSLVIRKRKELSLTKICQYIIGRCAGRYRRLKGLGQ